MKKNKIIQFSLVIAGVTLFFFTYHSSDKNKIDDIKKNALTEEILESTDATINILENVNYVGASGGAIFELDAAIAKVNASEPNISHLQDVVVVIKMNERTFHIRSDKALYDKTTNDCEFWGNVKATEQNNIITSDNLDLFMSKNLITAYNNLNVKYNTIDELGLLIADKIDIDIFKNEAKIFMFGKKDKVKVKYKN